MSHDELHPDQIIAIQLTGNTGQRFRYDTICEPSDPTTPPTPPFPHFSQPDQLHASPTLRIRILEHHIIIVSDRQDGLLVTIHASEIKNLVHALAIAAGQLAVTEARST